MTASRSSAGPDSRGPSTVFGVLGGIAAGKSAVSELLSGPEGVVISADPLAQEALDSPAVQEHLRSAYGDEVIGADGRTDRRLVAERVFARDAERERLEGWIHPLVRARISGALAGARASGAPRIVLDVPLLLENDAEHGFARECDHLIFVEASDEERDRRAVARRRWPPGEVARRESTQLALEEKRRRASYLVRNEGTLEELAERVRAVLDDLGLS